MGGKTKGFIKPLALGWAKGWVDRWAVCEVYEVWVDRWAEGEGKGGV